MNIEKLSDVFNGKVPGLNKSIDLESDNKIMKKQDPRSSIETYPEFNFNMLSLGKTKPLKKSGLKFDSDMEKKIIGNVTKKGKNVSEFNFTGFNNSLPSLNFKNPMGKKILGNTEKISWNRMKKQKGISMFGDWDKDKVPNVFDCNPKNFKKQAEIHDLLGIESIDSENNESSNEDLGVPNMLPNVESPQELQLTPLQEGVSEIKQTLPTVPKALWLGITKPFREANEEKVYQQKLREAAKQQILTALEKGKISGTKFLPELQKSSPYTEVRGALSKGTSQFRGYSEPQVVQSEGQRVANIIGIAPKQLSNVDMVRLGPQTYTPYSQNQYEQPIQTSTQQYTTQGPQGSPPEPGMVWSERSKRWVRYPRGQYSKRRTVVQYSPPPQPQLR